MKRCPQCQSTYTDDSLQFCLQDGISLVPIATYKQEAETLKIPNQLPIKSKPRLFLSMQMSDLAGDDYVQVRREIMEQVYDLRTDFKVYFFNEFVQTIEEFDEATFDVDKYLGEIDGCDFFIAIISDGVLSSIYFEAAYALDRGKTSIYFVKSDKV